MAERMSALKRHFGFTDDSTKALCKHCDKLVSWNGKTTSNLLTHLKRKHEKAYSEYISNDNEEPTKAQTTMSSFIKSTSTAKFSSNDPSQKQITDCLVSFIAGNLTPLSIVENPEFKALIESLNPLFFKRYA